MSTGFDVEPSEVAGFGEMAGKLSGPMADIAGHVYNEALLLQGVSGLLTAFQPPVDAYASNTGTRMFGHVDRLNGLSGALTSVAWRYSGRDQAAATVFEYRGSTRTSSIADFPGAASYPVSAHPALVPPEHGEVDLQGVIEEVGGSIRMVEWVLDKVFGWSLTEFITEPIAGNYTELDRAGQVLIQAGDAAETVAADLTAKLGRLQSGWSGGAADSCADYVGRLANGIEYEGPLNRIVGQLYQRAAAEFDVVGEFIATSLKNAIDKIVTAVGTSLVPLYGWKKAYDAAHAAWDIVQHAKAMVEGLQTLVSQVEAVVSVAEGEVDDLKDLSEVAAEFGDDDPEHTNIFEGVSQVAYGATIAEDLAKVAQVDNFTETPDDDYTVGPHPRRPE